MDMEVVRQLFIDESRELLAGMESYLLEVEDGSVSIEQHIDAIFRAVHTIKGSAGLFGFNDIVTFTHTLESVLDQVRDGALPFDNKLAALMLDCHVYLLQVVDNVNDSNIAVDSELGERLFSALSHYLTADTSTVIPLVETVHPVANVAESQRWHIQIQYGEDILREGMDPAAHLTFLQQLGTVQDVHLECNFPADGYDPEACYFELSIVFDSAASKQQIADVFEFVEDSCVLSIWQPVIFEQSPTLPQSQSGVDVPALSGAGIPEVSSAASQTTPQIRQSEIQFLKVEAKRLDVLINLIGELVTSRAANELLVNQLGNEKLSESFSVMSYLLEQIRDSALGLRMVQIGDSFSRLKRIVRDVSKEQGKAIQLEIYGDDTELDKSMVEKLSDPLMHLVRNALDHGIEPTDQRLAKGKSAQGLLKLTAYHEAGSVVIEVKDDGAGLNVERILEKARDKGLVQPDQQLTATDIYKLILEPGFSTATVVTNLSGRGVGLDVVRRNLEELRGQILIESEKDIGTTFRIRLPLTLAIIDGFEVSIGDTHFVLPLNMVQECIEFKDIRLTEQRDYLNLRGEVLPFIRVSDVLQVSTTDERENILVVQFGKNRAGLVVGQLHGELQAVIKPLHPMFKAAKGISGSTILGSGDVGFILDIPQLINFATDKEAKVCAYQTSEPV